MILGWFIKGSLKNEWIALLSIPVTWIHAIGVYSKGCLLFLLAIGFVINSYFFAIDCVIKG